MVQKIKALITTLLRQGQKFTGTDNVYLATQGSYLTIGNIINIATSFILAMAFARLLPKDIYGDYRYIISIMTIIGIFALPGMDDAILQAVANKFDGSFRKGLKEKFRWSILGSLSCLILGGYFFFFKDNLNLTICFLMASVFFPIMQSTGLYLSYLGGKKLFGIQVKYNVLTQVISSLAIIITLFLTKSLIILILTYFFSYTVLGTFFLFVTLKKIPAGKEENEEYIKFGKHLSFLRILHTIAAQADRILIFHFIGAASLAIYSFAVFPVAETNTLLDNIRSLALPKLASQEKAKIKKTLLKKVIKATILIAPLVLIYIIIAPYLYKIFFPQYMESVFFSQILFLTVLIFPASIVSLSFQAQMAKRELYQLGIIIPLFQIILLIILTPIYGILGVIIARLANQLIGICIAIYLFKKM